MVGVCHQKNVMNKQKIIKPHAKKNTHATKVVGNKNQRPEYSEIVPWGKILTWGTFSTRRQSYVAPGDYCHFLGRDDNPP